MFKNLNVIWRYCDADVMTISTAASLFIDTAFRMHYVIGDEDTYLIIIVIKIYLKSLC